MLIKNKEWSRKKNEKCDIKVSLKIVAYFNYSIINCSVGSNQFSY
jgi:hypothetical protein